MEKVHWKNALNLIDQEIQEAKFTKARALLGNVVQNAAHKLSRSERVRVAGFARRLDQSKLAYDLLAPQFREKPGTRNNPNNEETVEFARCLLQLGCPQYAQKMLESVKLLSFNHEIEALFGRILMQSWNYNQAKLHFEKAIFLCKSAAKNDYQLLIYQVNDLACRIESQESVDVFAISKDLLDKCLNDKFYRLAANVFELIGQYFIKSKKFNEALANLERAKFFLLKCDDLHMTLDCLYVEKWASFTKYVLNKNPKNIQRLVKIQNQAKNLGDFESVRSIDILIGEISNDKNMLMKAYFGTPFPVLKHEIQKTIVSLGYEIPAVYEWMLPKDKSDQVFSVVFDWEIINELLEKKPYLQKLANIFISDFYRPRRKHEIYFEMFPDAPLGMKSIDLKIRQLVCRLNRFWTLSRVPLLVANTRDGYTLTSTSSIILRVHFRRPNDRDFWQQLAQPFCSRDVACQQRLSIRSAQTLISLACNEGILIAQGNARARRYWAVSLLSRKKYNNP